MVLTVLMRHNCITLLLISVICFSAGGQSIISGTVTDSRTNSVLPYVNIGIRNKNIGTSSLSDGSFSIKIPASNENDTLTFSMVGYSDLHLPVKSIIATQQHSFQLKPKSAALKPVVITADKLTEKSFGIKNTSTLVNFLDGSTNQNDIFEIAQLIRMDTSYSKITSVNLHINENRSDSGTFRINFYRWDGSRPGERIIEELIVQRKNIVEGWLQFDLIKYNIYLKGNFVVAIEFIPSEKKNNPIRYELKLGGSSKSFVRTSSQGAWSVPPHHYRLFVNAFVADTKNKNQQENEEEKESIPTTTLYSETINESYSIFVSLPKAYTTKKDKRYPVIYLLDANVYFDIVAHIMLENKINVILVGIGYSDYIRMDSLRNRDYTFPEAPPQDSFPVSGNAINFLSFISNELLPYMDKTYRTDTLNRTLMGHSLGGYFTLFAMEQAIQDHNYFFNNYVAASPSFEYCNSYIVNLLKSISGEENTPQQTLFLTYGGREDSEEGGTGTTGMDHFNLYITLLSGGRFKNIDLKNEVYPSYGHMETAIPSFTKALREIK